MIYNFGRIRRLTQANDSAVHYAPSIAHLARTINQHAIYYNHLFTTLYRNHYHNCKMILLFRASTNVVAGGIMFQEYSCVVHACMYFERKYLWNGWRYQQLVNGVINYDLSHVEQKNFGELWSSNNDG